MYLQAHDFFSWDYQINWEGFPKLTYSLHTYVIGDTYVHSGHIFYTVIEAWISVAEISHNHCYKEFHSVTIHDNDVEQQSNIISTQNATYIISVPSGL